MASNAADPIAHMSRAEIEALVNDEGRLKQFLVRAQLSALSGFFLVFLSEKSFCMRPGTGYASLTMMVRFLDMHFLPSFPLKRRQPEFCAHILSARLNSFGLRACLLFQRPFYLHTWTQVLASESFGRLAAPIS
eukprot:6180080-Pleurochrysis_carterae.AAC.1